MQFLPNWDTSSKSANENFELDLVIFMRPLPRKDRSMMDRYLDKRFRVSTTRFIKSALEQPLARRNESDRMQTTDAFWRHARPLVS